MGGKENTWEELFISLDDGTYKDKYKIGDEFPLDLDDEGLIHMQIAGFDKDIIEPFDVTWLSNDIMLYDFVDLAKGTLIAKEIINNRYSMNESFKPDSFGTGTYGGYVRSYMSNVVCFRIFNRIPINIRKRIVLPIKKSCGYECAISEPDVMFSQDLVWVPSYNEVFGNHTRPCDPCYDELFSSDESRVKYKVGETDPSSWWLRSAVSHLCNHQVTYRGGPSAKTVSAANGVVFGFCVS